MIHGTTYCKACVRNKLRDLPIPSCHKYFESTFAWGLQMQRPRGYLEADRICQYKPLKEEIIQFVIVHSYDGTHCTRDVFIGVFRVIKSFRKFALPRFVFSIYSLRPFSFTFIAIIVGKNRIATNVNSLRISTLPKNRTRSRRVIEL